MRVRSRTAWTLLFLLVTQTVGVEAERGPAPHGGRPNIVVLLADDLGYSDVGCYGSEIRTPNLDRLAAEGVRFTQFYNAARCCPTRASLLTGLYPHRAGVGHMLQQWHPPGYTAGLTEQSATFAELLQSAGYRTYHVGKWHVGGVGATVGRNHPLNRGFDRAYGTGGGGNFFRPDPLYLDRMPVRPGPNYYTTDAFSTEAVQFLEEHYRDHQDRPFLLHLCYTAPHFPLHARAEDIARYVTRYRDGWDALRERRFARQRELGLLNMSWRLSPRDPIARPWSEVTDRDEWDLRYAVHAAMVDSMDQGIGRVLETLRRQKAERNTLVLFLSDNGASAEALDSWPNPARGHRPGSLVGSADSHRCIEIGWANAANTPFRENKMWAHEGGIATPLIARWPDGVRGKGVVNRSVGHVLDLAPTFLDLAGVEYPTTFRNRSLHPLEGTSLTPALRGATLPARELGWEHEGNRAYRAGDWKIVASFRGEWELYDLKADRTETRNLAARHPERVRDLVARWQAWADRIGVVPWDTLPGANYRPAPGYRKKSEPVG